MIYQTTIQINNQEKKATVEPSVYGGRTVFEVSVDDDYFVVFQDEHIWKTEDNDNMDQQLLNQIGSIIEEKVISPVNK